ncbi:nuclear transport factor 2 family protein [Shewanella avicenniae]|uniref:Nuclear transport factor 2 family protein n=1 Tax=Shewanella avicenniae TaxID=2814294 RepID=A0ABX7QT22_9GAMM|nr:nuclear transport factor 2 family protein [Shewanella avicenniae]QSX34569.1 nuclear transport factor 2 family protein [Shewanella avicenniae]
MTSISGTASPVEQQLVERFLVMYQRLNRDNLALLNDVYDDEVLFQDPLHQVRGIAALTEYFAAMYQNIDYIGFDMQQVLLVPSQAAITWRMQFQHPKLNGGRLISVDGMSFLTFSDKVTFHRDYFDVGQMLYEQLPLLGSAVRAIKRRAGV